MPRRELLTSHNVELLRFECRIWDDILTELSQEELGELSNEKKPRVLELSRSAQTILRKCLNEVVSIEDPLVFDARAMLERTLAEANELSDVMDSTFFVRMSAQWVDQLMDETESIEPDSVDENEKQQIKRKLRAIVDDIEATMQEIDPDSDDTPVQ